MPRRPPIVLHMIDDIENASPPQSIGNALPAVDPMNTPIQMSDLGDISLIILYTEPVIQSSHADIYPGFYHGGHTRRD
jgi:hypothetical protein